MSITKQDLIELKSARMKLNALQQELKDCEAAAEIGNRKLDMIPGKGSEHDRISEVVSKLIRIKEDLMEETLRYAEDNRKALDYISRLTDPCYSVIYRRYVLCEPYLKISFKLNRSIDGVKKIHQKAIRKLEEME